MEVSKNGGTPSHHSFLDGIFHYKPSFGGTPFKGLKGTISHMGKNGNRSKLQLIRCRVTNKDVVSVTKGRLGWRGQMAMWSQYMQYVPYKISVNLYIYILGKSTSGTGSCGLDLVQKSGVREQWTPKKVLRESTRCSQRRWDVPNQQELDNNWTNHYKRGTSWGIKEITKMVGL